MNTENLDVAAIMGALILLSLCVTLFVAAQGNPKLKARLPLLLYCFGIIPGFVGVLTGFWQFVTASVDVVFLFAYLLLEIDAVALLRVSKDQEIQKENKDKSHADT